MQNTHSTVSRRSFIRGAGATAAAAGTGAIVPAAIASETSEQSWDYETEVLVVGFGGAGACAAIEAADQGARVLVIEKNPEDNHLCNTLMSGGGWHSPDPDGDREALKEYLRALMSGDNLDWKTEGEHSPLFIDDIVEKFAEYEVQNFDFVTSLDPDFIARPSGNGGAFATWPGAEDSGYAVYGSSYNENSDGPHFPALDTPKEDTCRGLALFNCFKNGIAERGDAIQILWETPGKKLVMNDEGACIGVVATQGDRDVRIKAKKGVILTAGGYEYNEEMRRAFLPGAGGLNGWTFYGTTSNEGDGIRMAAEVGAQLAKVGKCAARFVFSCPDIKHNNCRLGSITPAVGADGTVCVNALGKRFMNEVLITKDPSRYFSYNVGLVMDIETVTYPNNPAYLIIDEEYRLNNSLVDLGTSTAGFGLIPWDEQNQTAIDNGWLIKADTFEELAEKIRDTEELNGGRMDPQAFVETMATWNDQIVPSGVDEEFGREAKKEWKAIATPPFYALPIVPGGPNTKGGIQTDGDRRVVDWSNNVIPRLYSAGEMSSVFKFVYQMGGNVTECIICGRIAGANAAAESDWDA